MTRFCSGSTQTSTSDLREADHRAAMRCRLAAVAAIAVTVTLVPPELVAGECKPAPAVHSGTGSQDLIIDARSGAPLTADRSFKMRDPRRIVVINKNPFRFQYALKIEEQVVQEPALAAFLKLPIFAGLIDAIEPKPSAAPLPRKKPPTDLTPADAQECDETWFLKLNEAQELLPELAALAEEARTTLNDAAQKVNAGKAAWDQQRPRLMSSALECSELRSSAETLSGAIDFTALSPLLENSKSKTDALRGGADFLLGRLAFLEAQLAVLRRESPRCYPAPDLDDSLNVLKLAANGAIREAEALAETRNKVAELSALLARVKEDVARVLAQPDAFFSVGWVGGYSTPTDVTVTLSRKDTVPDDAAFVDFQPVVLNFGGGPRFVLAAGVAFADLGVQEYERIQGFERDLSGNLVLDDNGDPRLATVVGLREDSDSRAAPLLILHCRLSNTSPWERWYFSLGLTSHEDNEGADVEVLVGPSYAIANDQFFVTLGAYYGQVQELRGDLFLGAPVPETVTELPVSKDREWAVAVAFSIKIR